MIIINEINSSFKKYNKSDVLIIFILAIVILARGIIQQNLVELTILTIGVFYLFTDKIRFNILDKPTRLLYLLCFIVFTISLYTTNNFNSFNIVYNFFLLLVFLSIFNSYVRAELFVFYCGFIISVICFFQILHLFDFIDITNLNLFYSRDGLVRSNGLIGNPNYSAYNSFVCFILLYFSRIKYKRIFLFLVAISVLITISRGVIFALIAFVFLMNLKLNKTTFVSVVFLFVGYTSLVKYLPEDFVFTITERFNVFFDEGDSSGRSGIWQHGYVEWSKDLGFIILGFGFNNFPSVVIISDLDLNVHNSFLRALYELGVVGFIVVFSFFYSIINQIKWEHTKEKYILIIALVISWMTNDFFILKETFFMIAVLLMMSSKFQKT
tara:strand:- start:6674 stop:7819 length:1146 start_codon:yes stop_codon:yes gene_type:complete